MANRIIRSGTVDLFEEPRSARQIVRECAEGLREGTGYGEAILALQATIIELREAASGERLRDAEEEIQARGGASSSIEEVERRLAEADEA